MKVLLDVNVILDVLLKRDPWAQEAEKIWQANHTRIMEGYVIATAVTTIFYIARKLEGLEVAQRGVRECMSAFRVIPVDEATLNAAMSLVGDFEDNVAIRGAAVSKLDWIVTRDPRGFASSTIPAISPTDLCAKFPA